MHLICLSLQGGLTTLNDKFMKDLSAVQNDLKQTEKQIETDLTGNLFTRQETLFLRIIPVNGRFLWTFLNS